MTTADATKALRHLTGEGKMVLELQVRPLWTCDNCAQIPSSTFGSKHATRRKKKGDKASETRQMRKARTQVKFEAYAGFTGTKALEYS
jgi:hypothetical protein